MLTKRCSDDLRSAKFRSRLLELLLPVTLCITVGGGLVVGTPLGRRIATFAFLTLLLTSVGTILLRKHRAVALEVAGSLTVVALVAA